MLNDMFDMKEDIKYRFPVRVYRVHFTGEDDKYERFYDLMPAERKKRADRLKNKKVRNQCIAAYALVDHAVCDLWDELSISDPLPAPLPDRPFRILENEKGKPYFKDIPVCFNLSHSGERIIVALSPLEVGCDVEHKNSNALKVAERFFAKPEYELLAALGDDDKIAKKFTGLWTIKESIVKCCGEGIGRGFDDFSVTDEDCKTKKSIKLSGDDNIYHIREYEGENGYRYSVCSLYDDFEDKIRDVTL